MRIFVVDDEKEIADLIEVYLKSEGYEVVKCYNGRQALEKIQNESFDLAILDVMLPYKSGDNVLSELRAFSSLPVIVL